MVTVWYSMYVHSIGSSVVFGVGTCRKYVVHSICSSVVARNFRSGTVLSVDEKV
jgi:hypothetical protein